MNRLERKGGYLSWIVAGITLGFIAVVGGLLFGAIPIAFHFRHERRKRELEHIERMKALELGRTLPQDEPMVVTDAASPC